jgi:hypothetical protein
MTLPWCAGTDAPLGELDKEKEQFDQQIEIAGRKTSCCYKKSIWRREGYWLPQ